MEKKMGYYTFGAVHKMSFKSDLPDTKKHYYENNTSGMLLVRETSKCKVSLVEPNVSWVQALGILPQSISLLGLEAVFDAIWTFS